MIYRIRRWIAFPFKLAGLVCLIIAMMISFKDGRETMPTWMKREFWL